MKKLDIWDYTAVVIVALSMLSMLYVTITCKLPMSGWLLVGSQALLLIAVIEIVKLGE